MTEIQAPAERIAAAIERATAALTSPGDWLTGAQRRAAWLEARDARTNPLDVARRNAISPNAVDGAHDGTDELAPEAVEVMHRIASDPGRLSRSWADGIMQSLGDTTYVELVGVAAISAVVDTFAVAMGEPVPAVPDAVDGAPAQIRPDTVGEVGAWVPQTVGGARANVSRSLSLVPETNAPWTGLVDALYSRGREFDELTWDRALSRPQVELVAARTTAELECFY